MPFVLQVAPGEPPRCTPIAIALEPLEGPSRKPFRPIPIFVRREYRKYFRLVLGEESYNRLSLFGAGDLEHVTSRFNPESGMPGAVQKRYTVHVISSSRRVGDGGGSSPCWNAATLQHL